MFDPYPSSFPNVNLMRLKEDKSSSSSQNSSYRHASSKVDSLQKRKISEVPAARERAASTTRSSKEGQTQKLHQSKSDEEKNNSAVLTSLQSLNSSFLAGSNQQTDLKNLRTQLRSSLSCKPIKREEGYTRDDSSGNSPPDSQIQRNNDIPSQGINNVNATLSSHDSDKNDSNSSSSKLTSNSITARSFKNRSNASVDSLQDAPPINQSNKVMRNSNCINNNSSVLGTKPGNFTEYGSICSKEEIKETINLYKRSGKPRENLITANQRYPIKPLLPEEVNSKTTIQADSSQGKSILPKRIIRSIMQRRVNTFEKDDLCQIQQISEVPQNLTEIIPQNELIPTQEKSEFTQQKQEEQPEKDKENTSQLESSQNKETEQIIDGKEYHHEEDQLNYQSEADIQIIKQVELLNSDSDGEQPIRKTDGVNLIQTSMNQPIQRPTSSLAQVDSFQNYPAATAQAQNSVSFEPFVALNSEFREPFQQLFLSPESAQEFQQFNPSQQQQQLLIQQQQHLLMKQQQQQQYLQSQQQILANQGSFSLFEPSQKNLIAAILNQQPQPNNLNTPQPYNVFSSNTQSPIQQSSQIQQMQHLQQQQQQQQQQQNFQFFGNPSVNQMQGSTQIRFPTTPPPVNSNQHNHSLQQQQISQQLQLQQVQQSMNMAQSLQHFHPQNMPLSHLMCSGSSQNISPQQIHQGPSANQKCNIFEIQPEIRQNSQPQETMFSSMKDRQKIPLQISSQSLFSSNSNSAHHLPNAKLNCNHSQASTSDSDLINTFRSGSSYGNVQDKQAEIVKFIQLQKLQQEQQQQQSCFFQQRTDPSEQFFAGSQFYQNQAPLQPNIPSNSQYNSISAYQQIYVSQPQEGFQGMQQHPIFQNIPSHYDNTQPIPSDSQFNLASSSIPLKAHHSKQLSCLQFGQFDHTQNQQQQLSQMQLQQLSQRQQMPQSLSASKIPNSLSNPTLNGNNNSFCVGSSSQAKGKKKLEIKDETMKYNIDLNKLEEDGRTTVYIQNIPNKYTLNWVLQAIQKNHQDNFDFFYLPIDFQNKCNVGYAFINFIKPEFIRQFFLEFNGKKWKKFNSDKICNLKYARIQGRVQLEEHFQNSSVMNQREKKFKPVFLSISDLIQSQKQQQNQQVYPQQMYESQQQYDNPSYSSNNQSNSYHQHDGQRNYQNQSRHNEKHQKPHYYEQQQQYVQKQ